MRTPRCGFCGRELEPIEVRLLGSTVVAGYRDCGCPQAQAQAAAERSAKERAAAQDAIRRRVACGIPPRFAGVEPKPGWRNGAYVFGPTGTGKTQEACALANYAIDDGRSVRFVEMGPLLDAVSSAFRNDTTPERVLAPAKTCDLLVIDDLLKESYDPKRISRLYEVVNARYNAELPTIVTCNYTLPEMGRALSAGMGRAESDKAVAIVSRLAQSCPRVEMKGRDLRIGPTK